MSDLRIRETSSYRKNPAYAGIAIVNVRNKFASFRNVLASLRRLIGDIGSFFKVGRLRIRFAPSTIVFTIADSHGLCNRSALCNQFKPYTTVVALPYFPLLCVTTTMNSIKCTSFAGNGVYFRKLLRPFVPCVVTLCIRFECIPRDGFGNDAGHFLR